MASLCSQSCSMCGSLQSNTAGSLLVGARSHAGLQAQASGRHRLHLAGRALEINRGSPKGSRVTFARFAWMTVLGMPLPAAANNPGRARRLEDAIRSRRFMSHRYTACARRFATLNGMEQATASIDPRHPIGRFQPPAVVTSADRARFIGDIRELPRQLRDAVAGLTDEQLDTPYRDGGWTVRQVVHHLADSHMNSFVRFKLALTEDSPMIKPYDESAWAETADSLELPLEPSIAILDGLHRRWVALLQSLREGDFERAFTHPERGPMRLDLNLALYSWHGRHHAAHITALRERMGWR